MGSVGEPHGVCAAQEAAVVRGKRQDADEHVEPVEKARELRVARAAVDAFDLLSRPREAARREPVRRERACDRGSDHAEPRHVDREVRPRSQHLGLPVRVAQPDRVAVETAIHAQYRGEHVLGERVGHAGVFQPHQRHIARQRRHREQRVDAGAECEERAQPLPLSVTNLRDTCEPPGARISKPP